MKGKIEQMTVRAQCENCTWTADTRNAQGLAARHAERYEHFVVVSIKTEMSYGQHKAGPMLEMFEDEKPEVPGGGRQTMRQIEWGAWNHDIKTAKAPAEVRGRFQIIRATEHYTLIDTQDRSRTTTHTFVGAKAIAGLRAGERIVHHAE